MMERISRSVGALAITAALALFGITLSAAPAAAAGKSQVVYITFDDGPSVYTPQVLKVLSQYGVHATFFEVGQMVAAHPSSTSQVYRQGNSVQNHTWSHPDLRKLTAAQFADQVSATDRQIRSHTGYLPCCLRPPFGAVDATVRARAAGLGKKSRCGPSTARLVAPGRDRDPEPGAQPGPAGLGGAAPRWRRRPEPDRRGARRDPQDTEGKGVHVRYVVAVSGRALRQSGSPAIRQPRRDGGRAQVDDRRTPASGSAASRCRGTRRTGARVPRPAQLIRAARSR